MTSDSPANEAPEHPGDSTTDAPRRLGLADAYSVQTPDDNRALYRDWASTYEADFIEPRGYIYHEGVVAEFADRGGVGPVLDVGCGTGLAGRELAARGLGPIDGIDISPEMLAEAVTTGVFRSLAAADVTQRLPIEDDAYMGVVSVGTFTHGHLGPEPLTELARIVAPGGWLAIGIHSEHYETMCFAETIQALVDTSVIEHVEFAQVRIYRAADDDRADDLATVALLQRTQPR